MTKNLLSLIALGLAFVPIARAHDTSDPNHVHAANPPTNQVSIRIESAQRIITANGWPDHAPGTFPRRGNPNTASPQSFTFLVPVKPAAAETTSRRGG